MIRFLKLHFSFIFIILFLANNKYCYSQDINKLVENFKPELVPQLGVIRDTWHAVFSPNGQLLLTGGGGTDACLWEVATGKEIRAFRHPHSGIFSVAFSPDGKNVLTGNGDGIARLWKTTTGKLLTKYIGHNSILTSVAFSCNGKYILTGGFDKTVRLWNTYSGKEIRKFLGHSREVTSVAFSPNGKYILSSSYDKTVLWNITTGKKIRKFMGHTEGVESAAFSSDGKHILTSIWDKTVRIWNTSSGKEINKFVDHAKGNTSVAFSPDGKYVLTGNRENTACLWDISTGKEIRKFIDLTNGIKAIAFSSDGKYTLTGSANNTTCLWDISTGTKIREFRGFINSGSLSEFSSDGKMILFVNANSTRLWSTSTGMAMKAQEESKYSNNSAVLSPDGKFILTGCNQKIARLLDSITGKEIRKFEGHNDRIYDVNFSKDGKYVLTVSLDHTARIWSSFSGKEFRKFEVPVQYLKSVDLSNDGKYILISGSDYYVHILEIETGNEIKKFPEKNGHSSCCFSPDNKYILIADRVVHLYDIVSGKELRSFNNNKDFVSQTLFSPTGKYVLIVNGHYTARLLETSTGLDISKLSGYVDSIKSASFSPDDKYILICSEDRTIKIWDTLSGKELCTLISFNDGTWAVTDKDGRYDASNPDAIEGLHWVLGMEPIDLGQLKSRYYDPGLLAKYMGFIKEPLRNVTAFNNVKLYPKIETKAPVEGTNNLKIRLVNQGGGIGKVRILVNGKEVLADARGPKPQPDAPSVNLNVDLSAYKSYLLPGQQNTVEVFAFNSVPMKNGQRDEYLSSRGMKVLFTAKSDKPVEPPTMWAVVAGVSHYRGGQLDLNFAAKDAEDFARALKLAAEANNYPLHLTVLSAPKGDDAIAADKHPNRHNIMAALNEFAAKAKSTDILVVFLAGHGVALGGVEGDYYYLTDTALDTELKDQTSKNEDAISGKDIADALYKIPALKQALILDTCAAGKFVQIAEKREITGSMKLSWERMKDRAGMFILAGCAADASSYEASRYDQGLLTYSLLEAIRSGTALHNNEFVDVNLLFQKASERVEELAKDIGGIQKPVFTTRRDARTFDLGRVTDEIRAKIPLSKLKAVIVRPEFQEETQFIDVLHLGEKLDKQLHEVAARGADKSFIYWDVNSAPDAFKLSGRYTIHDQEVSVIMKLSKENFKTVSLSVEGKKDDIDRLINLMISAVNIKLDEISKTVPKKVN